MNLNAKGRRSKERPQEWIPAPSLTPTLNDSLVESWSDWRRLCNLRDHGPAHEGRLKIWMGRGGGGGGGWVNQVPKDVDDDKVVMSSQKTDAAAVAAIDWKMLKEHLKVSTQWQL